MASLMVRRTETIAPAGMVRSMEDLDSTVVAAGAGIMVGSIQMTRLRGRAQAQGLRLILFMRSFAGLHCRIACTSLSRRW